MLGASLDNLEWIYMNIFVTRIVWNKFPRNNSLGFFYLFLILIYFNWITTVTLFPFLFSHQSLPGTLPQILCMFPHLTLIVSFSLVLLIHFSFIHEYEFYSYMSMNRCIWTLTYASYFVTGIYMISKLTNMYWKTSYMAQSREKHH